MPARDTAPAGAPCWVDLLTSDAERSRDFYGQVFGWTATESREQFGGYFNFIQGRRPGRGGHAQAAGMEAPDTWSVYLATDDAQKTIEAATAHGGQVMLPAMPVADLGTMGMVADPGGAAIGMWQPGLHKGFGVVAEAGPPAGSRCTPGTTRPPSRSTVTCSAGKRRPWATRPSSATRSASTARTSWPGSWTGPGSCPRACRPTGWSTSAPRTPTPPWPITSLGGSVVRPAEDTPYGRLAEAADPTGVHFKLVAPNEAMPARNS